MRWWVVAAYVCVLAGCRGRRDGLAGRIDFASPAAAPRIEYGVWQIEDRAWRWTAGHFSFRLSSPVKEPSTLVIALVVPPIAIEHHRSLTMSCDVNGFRLASQTWSVPGNYLLVRDVPALDDEVAHVSCWLDHVIAPSAADARELGLILKRARLGPRRR